MIQCAFRCARAWCLVEDLLWEKHFAQRAEAAAKIQSFFVMAARRLSYQKSLRAAKKIQAFLRKQKLRAQARIQREFLAEADALLALCRASDEEARKAESLLVIKAAAEETKDNEGKYTYHVCSFS